MPSIAQTYDETVAFQRERHANPDKYRGWSWFVPAMNKICGRIQPGWDVRVCGLPKVGKTTAMIAQAITSMREGANIFYIGNEEDEGQLMLRMITNFTSVERNKFRDLAMASGDWEKVDGVKGVFHEFRGRLEFGITTIEDVIAEVGKMSDLDMVFLDHQQLFETRRRYDSQSQILAEVSRGIKLLTLNKKKEIGADPKDRAYHKMIATVTAVHLNDDGKPLGSRGPLRDGDVILNIDPRKDATGAEIPTQRMLLVTLSRHGGTGESRSVYINGAMSQMAELYEERVDINELAQKLLDQPRTK